MTEAQALSLVQHALVLLVKVAGPILIVSLVIGLAVSIFQSLTQINDYTLTFVPKAIAIAIVLVVAGHWILGQLITYTTNLYTSIPRVVSGG